MPKMHADEVHADERLVHRLLAAQFPELSHLPVERVRWYGTDNTLYRVGPDLVARLPRRAKNVVALEKELTWLPRLAPVLPLAVPTPVAVGEPGEGYPFPWAVYRWLPGLPATNAPVDAAAAVNDLAALFAALWTLDPSDGPLPGEHNAFRGVPLATRDAATRAAVEALAGRVDVEGVLAVWDEALAAPPWDRPPVWLHGDLDARNVLVEVGRLSAVVDWGTLGVGDPACDVMVAWKLLPATARDELRRSIGVDNATWTRARGWAVSQAMMALSYYTLESNAILVREAERWLAEVLAES